MNLENYMFARRGHSVQANELWLLCDCDHATYRQALGVARGNNVKVHGAYAPKIDVVPYAAASSEIREITRRR